MTFSPRQPYDNRLAAARMVLDRVFAAITVPLIRDKVRSAHPSATELRATIREQEPGYFVFTEARAVDEHGNTLGGVPFRRHVLEFSDRNHAYEDDPDRHFSDADTMWQLSFGSAGSGEYRVLLDVQRPGLGLPDLFEVMPADIREIVAHFAVQYTAEPPDPSRSQ